MSEQEVTFLRHPRIGIRAEIILSDGRSAITSVVKNVWRDQSKSNRYHIITSSGSCYAGYFHPSASAIGGSSDTRERLITLVEEYGQSLYDDPRRCNALLLDLLDNARDVKVLSAVVSAGILNELVSRNPGIPCGFLVRKLAKTLYVDYGLSEDLALWAVESWALALGVIASDDLVTNTHATENPDHPVETANHTYFKDERDFTDKPKKSSSASSEGDCFVATACFGTAHAPEIRLLRMYRDTILVRCHIGRAFIRWYYTCGPQLADCIRYRPAVKSFFRNMLIRPCALVAAFFLKMK